MNENFEKKFEWAIKCLSPFEVNATLEDKIKAFEFLLNLKKLLFE